MIVLDTTVLVYAKGADHELREPCRQLIEAAAGGRLSATTSSEVIQQFAHVRARRRGRADAATLARDYAEVLAPLLVIDAEQLARGLDLFKTVKGLGAFDAVLAAATTELTEPRLISADRAFGRVPGLEHLVPDRPTVQALLAG